MKNKQTTTFKNATGKIDYTLMNDCMFHSVMTQNGNVLKGLVCALLRLKPDRVHSITVRNPYELGSDIRDKNFILDIKILLNDRKVINIELRSGRSVTGMTVPSSTSAGSSTTWRKAPCTLMSCQHTTSASLTLRLLMNILSSMPPIK